MNGPASTVDAILDQHRPARSQEPNILRTLLAVQDAVGYVPLEKVGRIARSLGVTESDIAGVISYYPDVRTGPSRSPHHQDLHGRVLYRQSLR